jgi:hypothetical protein
MRARATKSPLLRKALPITCAAAWVGAFVATHIPARNIPHVAGDKTLHAVGYFGLCAVFVLALWARRVRPLHRVTLAWWVLAAYAALDELTQPFVGRTAAWADWLADLVGIVAAVVIIEGVLWLRGRLRERGRGVDSPPPAK